MSKTFIGQLILRLRAQGLGEAKRVENAVSQIDRAARNLAGAPWGANFQRQLDKLSPTTRQIHQIRRSWLDLHKTMNDKNLTGAARQAALAQWSNATIGHFSALKTNADAAEKSVRNLHRVLGRAVGKPLMVMGGSYTLAYMGGMVMSRAMEAASNARRVEAEAKFAGLSDEERGKIDARAEDLTKKYRLEKADMYEILKEASLSMPSTESALAVSDGMARAFLILSSMTGPEAGIAGLRSFNKAMDNIEKIRPEEYMYFLENYMKAQQVIGRDIDPDAYAQAIKYSRSGGKVYGDEFMAQWLPMLIAETGGSDAGTQIRAAFDQFIVGRASKAAIAEQKRYGVRREDGQLIGGDKAFSDNPIKWVNEYLLPQLQKGGVDLDDETQVAKVIGKLTNNRLSSDLLSRIVFSYDQYHRLVEERLPNAVGLEAADMVQDLNPFAAWQGFKDSLKNLSEATLPMEGISSGLNSLADTINAFRERIQAGDPTIRNTALGAGAIGAAWATWKITAGIWGLITAGASLNAAAVSLQAAAVSLGGAGGADILTDGKPKKKPGSFWGMLLTRAPWIAALLTAGSTADNEYLNKSEEERQKERDEARLAAEVYNLKQSQKADADNEARNKEAELDREQSLDSYLDGPPKPVFSEVEIYKRVLADETSEARPAALAPSSETPLPAEIDAVEAPFPSTMGEAVRSEARQSAAVGDPPAVSTGAPNGFQDTIDMALSAAEQRAAQAGQKMESSLAIKATPNVDTTFIDDAIERAKTLLSLLKEAGQAASSANASAEAELRRVYSDYGVAP